MSVSPLSWNWLSVPPSSTLDYSAVHIVLRHPLSFPTSLSSKNRIISYVTNISPFRMRPVHILHDLPRKLLIVLGPFPQIHHFRKDLLDAHLPTRKQYRADAGRTRPLRDVRFALLAVHVLPVVRQLPLQILVKVREQVAVHIKAVLTVVLAHLPVHSRTHVEPEPRPVQHHGLRPQLVAPLPYIVPHRHHAPLRTALHHRPAYRRALRVCVAVLTVRRVHVRQNLSGCFGCGSSSHVRSGNRRFIQTLAA